MSIIAKSLPKTRLAKPMAEDIMKEDGFRFIPEEKLIMEWQVFSRKIGFLRPGWWIIHLLGISVVYTIGQLLWR